MLAGHMIAGGCWSFTVTVKLHDAVFPEVSVAVAVTVVVPFGNAVPDGGFDTTVTPGQLSVAVTVNVVTDEHTFGSVAFTMFAGHVTTGGCVSFTVTVNEHVVVFGGVAASLTVHVTVVTPFGKTAPDAGLHATVPTPAQLSVAVGVTYVVTAEHRFGSVGFTRLAGHVIAGAWVSFTVTVKVQVVVFGGAAASLTVQVTVVTPFAKVVPDAGVHTGVPTPGQLSVAVGVV
jgi:hypothetical protein